MSSYDNPPPSGGGYGAPPPPPPGGGYGGAYGQPPRTDPKAIWSLVLGILGLVCCGFVTGIPAVILGKSSQKSIDASGGALQGRGLATAGFVIGIIAIVWGVISVVLYLTGVLTFDSSFSTSP